MTDKIYKVQDILPAGTWSNEAYDQVILDYEDRFRRRIVLTGKKGHKFLLELAHPQLLHDGDGLLLETEQVIRVTAAPERLAEVRGKDIHHMMRIAWHLGNRHLPTQILEDRLVIRDDYVMIDMVEKLGGQITKITGPFTPEGGAYGHGAVHGHSHSHGHDHAHSHPHSEDTSS